MDIIEKATEILDQGFVVGMPTETVYGLAARIDRPAGIESIFKVKERPFFDPLIVHVASLDQARALTTEWSSGAQALAQAFWPGPLTLVLPKSSFVNSMITSGLETVGIRMPNHPLALELIRAVGVPLAAPSANKFGRTSPTRADHVQEEFKNENVLVIDGGPCQVGLESTVLSLHFSQSERKYQLAILREGAISRAQIEKIMLEQNLPFQFQENPSKRESPGQMKHHYMPKIPLIIIQPDRDHSKVKEELKQKISELPDQIEGVTLIRPTQLDVFYELTLPRDPVLAARELYQRLREGGQSQADVIYFRLMPEVHTPEWAALRDRLFKAASLVLG